MQPTVWEEPGFGPLPPLRGTQRVDVAVVGLGAAGLSAVLRLREMGLSVAGIDAGTVGGGASGRNGGFLLAGLADFHHRAAAALGRERATALYRLTLDELDRAARATPEAVRRTGSLRIAVDDAEMDDCLAQERAMRADGLPVERYDGPLGVGLRFPHDGALQPLRRCRLLAQRALDAGARLHERSPALAIAGDRVATPEGELRCEKVVVCVDGALERLLPELAPTARSARAQMLATAPAPEVSIPCPVYARWGYDYWQQLPDGRVALGGCRDRGGDEEWTTRAEPTTAMQARLERLLRRLGVRAAVTHRWAGVIAFTPDPLPVLSEPRPGVLVVGGYRGTGNLLGPVYGRTVAELAATGAAPLRDLLSAPAAP